MAKYYLIAILLVAIIVAGFYAQKQSKSSIYEENVFCSKLLSSLDNSLLDDLKKEGVGARRLTIFNDKCTMEFFRGETRILEVTKSSVSNFSEFKQNRLYWVDGQELPREILNENEEYFEILSDAYYYFDKKTNLLTYVYKGKSDINEDENKDGWWKTKARSFTQEKTTASNVIKQLPELKIATDLIDVTKIQEKNQLIYEWDSSYALVDVRTAGLSFGRVLKGISKDVDACGYYANFTRMCNKEMCTGDNCCCNSCQDGIGVMVWSIRSSTQTSDGKTIKEPDGKCLERLDELTSAVKSS